MSSWRPSTTSRPLTLLVKANLETGVGFFFENDSTFGRNIVTVAGRENIHRRQVGQALVDLVEDGGQVLLGELDRALVLADLAHDVQGDGAVSTLLVGARHVSATLFPVPGSHNYFDFSLIRAICRSGVLCKHYCAQHRARPRARATPTMAPCVIYIGFVEHCRSYTLHGMGWELLLN